MKIREIKNIILEFDSEEELNNFNSLKDEQKIRKINVYNIIKILNSKINSLEIELKVKIKI